MLQVIPTVRAALSEYPRRFAVDPPSGFQGAVLDGRDVGTVLCPDADVKLFLTASAEVSKLHLQLAAACCVLLRQLCMHVFVHAHGSPCTMLAQQQAPNEPLVFPWLQVRAQRRLAELIIRGMVQATDKQAQDEMYHKVLQASGA